MDILVFLLAGLAYAFDKLNTLNLNTPYDYNSVMQYHRSATKPLIKSFKIYGFKINSVKLHYFN